ncbi:hypothetical protein ACJEKK_25620, partial [Escherichia coli]
RQAQPLQIDLGRRALAMTWVLQGGNTIPQDGQELWRMPLDGRPGTLLDAAGMRECGFGGPISFVWLISPSLTGRRVQYLRTT